MYTGLWYTFEHLLALCCPGDEGAYAGIDPVATDQTAVVRFYAPLPSDRLAFCDWSLPLAIRALPERPIAMFSPLHSHSPRWPHCG